MEKNQPILKTLPIHKSSKIKILIADDHRIVREGIRSSLANFSFATIVGEAEDGREALRKVQELRPDIVLMDLDMPKLDGLKATAAISKKFIETKVIALTMYDNKDYVLQILRAGGKGYVLKDTSAEQLASAIQLVHAGQAFFSPTVSLILQEYVQSGSRTSQVTLTRREKEIIALIARGKITKEIADQLKLSRRTVETYRARMLHKLKARNTAELTKFAVENNLIQP